jgi:hypothetical protein
VEVVASRHFDYTAEAVEPGRIVPVFVGVTGWEVLSRRAVEQGRSLLESSFWSGGKLCAGRQGLKQRTGLGGLEYLVRLIAREIETWMHTRDLRAIVSLWLVSG